MAATSTGKSASSRPLIDHFVSFNSILLAYPFSIGVFGCWDNGQIVGKMGDISRELIFRNNNA